MLNLSLTINPEFSVWGMLFPIYPIYCSSVLIVFCRHCLVHVEKVVPFLVSLWAGVGISCIIVGGRVSFLEVLLVGMCPMLSYYWRVCALSCVIVDPKNLSPCLLKD